MKSDKHTAFNFGDTVTKVSGSSWTGKVVGFYSTDLTPEGYCVESLTETGSVQIYPVKALKKMLETCDNCEHEDGDMHGFFCTYHGKSTNGGDTCNAWRLA